MCASNLTKLLNKYAFLKNNPPRRLTPDQQRSLCFYESEIGESTGKHKAVRLSGWIASVQLLDAFVARENRWPRENNKLPREAISDEERSLVEWVRYQRRDATRERHCEYQRERLEAIPGFSWDRDTDFWNQMFHDFARFVGVNRRVPRQRSEDPAERQLATWATRQRKLLRKGLMDPERAKALAQLDFSIR